MQAAKKIIYDKLSPLYSKQEMVSISKLIFERVLGLSRLQLHLNQHELISPANLAQITEIVNRLFLYEPIQYILGETEFYGLPLKVNSATLIPRPETEELVEWIINDCSLVNPIILDIGTGGGCIAVALSKNIPGAVVEGWDISSEALMVAQKNANINQVKVEFVYADILNHIFPVQRQKFDIIVSNPPYVMQSEELLMHKNVTQYEPATALFVPDADPLIFYNNISDLAISRLKPGGKLFFEINEKFGTETSDLLSSKGFKKIILRKDINGKERMIKAELDNLAI